MKRELSRIARSEVQEAKSAGVLSWTIVTITALLLIITVNPFGHGHHHWFWAAIVLIVGLPSAAIAENRHKRNRKRVK